jgi:hypothetical protein
MSLSAEELLRLVQAAQASSQPVRSIARQGVLISYKRRSNLSSYRTAIFRLLSRYEF